MGFHLDSEGDLSGVIEVIGAGRADPSGQALPWAMLDGILRLIPCDEVSWCELDWSGPDRIIQQGVDSDGSRVVQYGFDGTWVFDLLRQFGCGPGPSPDVHRWSDMYTARELLAQPAYVEYFRADIAHELCVSFPALPGRTRRLLLRRADGSDFSVRDVALMDILRPHIFETFQLLQHRRVVTPLLTERESQVLDLLARGMRNDEIATVLFISVATVRKHVEHIFDRTGLRSRSAVVASLIHHPEPSFEADDLAEGVEVFRFGRAATEVRARTSN